MCLSDIPEAPHAVFKYEQKTFSETLTLTRTQLIRRTQTRSVVAKFPDTHHSRDAEGEEGGLAADPYLGIN